MCGANLVNATINQKNYHCMKSKKEQQSLCSFTEDGLHRRKCFFLQDEESINVQSCTRETTTLRFLEWESIVAILN